MGEECIAWHCGGMVDMNDKTTSEVDWWAVAQTRHRRRVALKRDQVWSLVMSVVEDDIVSLGIEMSSPTDEWMESCMNAMNQAED
eukprot:5012312-Amphidinium_carterae.1